MKSGEFTLLRPVEPAEKCYLSEVLLWRAFGRFPEMAWDGDEDLRFSEDNRDAYGYSAPIWDGPILEEGETRFAGLESDPRLISRLSDGEDSPIEHYDEMLSLMERRSPPDPQAVADYRERRREAVEFHAAFEEWSRHFNEYLDEFKAEICLALRRGALQAFGTQLPNPDRTKTDEILAEKEIGLGELDVGPIPRPCWISNDVDWEGSSLTGRNGAFIWIHVVTEDMVKLFPPQVLIAATKIHFLGGSLAVVSSTLNSDAVRQSKRGRPSLPWNDMHVEVARLFRDGEMPKKKEAAIAYFQQWFSTTHNTQPSRAAIGERLKPYFDRLVR